VNDTKSLDRHISPVLFYFLLLTAFCGLGSVAPACQATTQSDDVWLLVDTRTLTLKVMEGPTVKRTFENIAIGSNGASREKQMMDEKTPLGDFRISWIKANSRFHLFLAIDYPNMEYARWAFEEGRISYGEYHALREAWKAGNPPPQNTSLGGYLGIHGVGAGNSEVHTKFNWTNGCVAVTNEQIDELTRWVGVGTRVSIR